jgi:hypothetical protein
MHTSDLGGHAHLQDDEEPFEMIQYQRRRITEEDTQLVIPRFSADEVDTGNPSRILPQN